MAMNKARRTANLNNILTYDTLGNSTLIANLTVEGLTGAGFVKADAAGLLSVDTAAYTVVTGATNYLTKITAPNTLGQSLVYDNGTSVLVNTAVGVPGYSHAFQVMANGAGGLVVSTTDVASAIGIVNSSSANKTWDISPYGNHLVINESGIATRMKFDAGGNITIGDITNSGHKLEVVGSFRTTGTNTLSALQGVGDRMVVANTNGVLTTQPIPTGSITGTGAAGQVNFWTGTTTVSGSNNLFWDNANNKLTVGSAFSGTQQNFNVYSGALFQQAAGDDNKVYIGNNSSPLAVDGRLLITPYRIKLNSNSGTLIFSADNLNTGSSISLNARNTDSGSVSINANNTDAFKIFGLTRNVAIQNGGTFTDNGQRLQVYGDTLLRGSGNTSATTALSVQNSDSSNMLQILNNGYIRLGNLGNASFRIYSSTVASGGDVDLNGEFLTLNSRSVSTETGSAAGFIHINGVNAAAISGIQNVVSIQKGFAPTSGSAIHTSLIINPNINQTGGANGITRGLYVNPTLTAAADWRSIEWSNNTGWGIYGAGTAPNYVAGTFGIGAGASAGYNFVVARNITGNIESGGIRQYGAVLADVSTVGIGIRNQLNVGAGVALNSYQHYRADVFSFGAGATLVTQIGFLAENTLTNATNNYGFFGNIAAATGRWNLYMAGTANNHMAGALGIGSTGLTGYSIRVSRAITGNTISSSIVTDSVIQSDVTNMAHGYYSGLYTAAASFTLDNLRHFYAEAGTFGAGSTVATQIGFGVSSNLTAATNNYGFFGGIPSGTNRWNLYMAGTANNYLNGSLLIGSATDDTVNKLQVTGTIVAGSGSSTTGSVILRGSYTAGYLTILGTDASSGGPMLSYGIQSAQNSTAGAFVSSSAITIPRSAYVQNGGHIWYTAPSSSTAIGTAVVPTKHMELYNSGNLVLGGGADDTVNRLQVGGNAFIKGTGNTSATFALTVQNSDSTNMFRVRNDGLIISSTFVSGGGVYSGSVTSATNGFIACNPADSTVSPITSGFDVAVRFTDNRTPSNAGYSYWFMTMQYTNLSYTSGTGGFINVQRGFAPTSGTGIFNAMILQNVINQTGGANGVTRGLYINPTLTAAADWRSIEWSNNTGWGLYGVGTAPNYMAGDLAIGGTTIDANTAIQINSAKGIKISGTGGGFGYGILRGTETSAFANSGSATIISSTNQISFQTATLTRLTIDTNGIVSINTNGQSRIISSRVGANSNGNNIFIGDGGNSAIGDVGNTLLGSGNVSLGTLNQTNVSTGYYNSSVGYGALGSVTTGFGNTAVGTTAMLAITAGSSNTALGYNAGRYFSSTGTNTNASATGSVYLGSETRASASGNSNEIIIGTSTTGNGSNTVTLGNTSITATYLRGNVTTNGSVVAGGSVRSEVTQAAVTNNVSVALLGSNITTYAAGFNMTNLGYGLNAMYAQHEQRFGGNATFAHANLNGGGLIINKLAPTAAGTVTITQQTNQLRTMSNLHLMTQFEGNNNLTVTDMSGLHIYGHYRTSGTGTITVSNAYYGIFLADPNEFGAGATVSGSNWGIYQQGTVPTNYFEGSMLIGTATTDANNKLVVAGNVRASQFRLTSLNTAPATSTSAGVLGEIRIDADNIYVCTATNTWKRAAIATF